MTINTTMLLADDREVILVGDVQPPLRVGSGNERRTEPAEVSNVTASTIDGETYELDPEQQEQAEAALVEAWEVRTLDNFLRLKSE